MSCSYDRTIQSLNNRLGNTMQFDRPIENRLSFGNFDKSGIVENIRPYSLQLFTFVIVFVLLCVFKPNFVMMPVIVDGKITPKPCYGKIFVWSIVVTILVTILVQLYKAKIVNPSAMFCNK